MRPGGHVITMPWWGFVLLGLGGVAMGVSATLLVVRRILVKGMGEWW
jgi:hypothetical protein